MKFQKFRGFEPRTPSYPSDSGDNARETLHKAALAVYRAEGGAERAHAIVAEAEEMRALRAVALRGVFPTARRHPK